MTYNDFVMESAMVEATNDTDINDIGMAQLDAELSVLEACLDTMYKYSLISEYAQCDVDEFYEESAADWLKEKASAVGSTLKKWGETILEKIKAIVKWIINLFKGGSTFEGLAKKAEKIKDKIEKSEMPANEVQFTWSKATVYRYDALQKIIEAYDEVVKALNKTRKNENSNKHTQRVIDNKETIDKIITELGKYVKTSSAQIEKISDKNAFMDSKFTKAQKSTLSGYESKATIDELISELKELAKKTSTIDAKAKSLFKACDIAKSNFVETSTKGIDKSDEKGREKFKDAKQEGLDSYKQIKIWSNQLFDIYAAVQKKVIGDYQGIVKELGYWEKKLTKGTKKGDMDMVNAASTRLGDMR